MWEFSNRIEFFAPQILIFSALMLLIIFLWRKYEKSIGIESEQKELSLSKQLSICFLISLLCLFIFIFHIYKYNLQLFIVCILFLFFVLILFMLSVHVFLYYIASLPKKLSVLLSLTLSALLFICTLACVCVFPFPSFSFFYIPSLYLLNFSGVAFSVLMIYIVISRRKHKIFIDEKSNKTIEKYLSIKKIVYVIALFILIILLAIVLFILLIFSQDNEGFIILGMLCSLFVGNCFPFLIFFDFILTMPVLFVLRATFFEKVYVLIFFILALFNQTSVTYALSIGIPYKYHLILLLCFSVLTSTAIFFWIKHDSIKYDVTNKVIHRGEYE
jgi:hypothetical protein